MIFPDVKATLRAHNYKSWWLCLINFYKTFLKNIKHNVKGVFSLNFGRYTTQLDLRTEGCGVVFT